MLQSKTFLFTNAMLAPIFCETPSMSRKIFLDLPGPDRASHRPERTAASKALRPGQVPRDPARRSPGARQRAAKPSKRESPSRGGKKFSRAEKRHREILFTSAPSTPTHSRLLRSIVVYSWRQRTDRPPARKSPPSG